jgi:hypothetical protein
MSETKPGIEGDEKMGAPKSAEESAFLSTPELSSAADKALEYQNLNSEKRRKFIDTIVVDLVNNPKRLINFFDALAIMSEVGAYKTENFIKDIEKGLDRMRLGKFPPSVEVMRDWLTLYVESDLYHELVEKIIKGMFEKCHDETTVLQFLYDLFCGAFSSYNQSVLKKVLDIISCRTVLLHPDSKQLKLFFLSSLSLDNRVLKMYYEINQAISLLLEEDSEIGQEISRLFGEVSKQNILTILHFINKHPERYQQILSTPLADQVKVFRTATQPLPPPDRESNVRLNKFLDYPAHLITLVRERMGLEGVEEKGKRYFALSLPSSDDKGLNVKVDESQVIPSILESINIEPALSGQEISGYAQPEYLQTISHLIPERIKESGKIEKLANLNETIRADIKYNTKYLLSPRGDLVLITDKTLRQLGYEKILFRMDKKNKRETVIEFKVGKCWYGFMLDEFFSPALMGEQKKEEPLMPLILPKQGVFLMNIVLSHLHQIRCSERVIEESSDSETEAKALFLSRRAHLRRLPKGQNPTQHQIMRAMETYDIDIVRINREAAAKGEERKRTFVFEAETAASAGLGPVISKAPDATKQMQEILNG